MKNKNKEKIEEISLKIDALIENILVVSAIYLFILMLFVLLSTRFFLNSNIFTIIELLFILFTFVLLFGTYRSPWPNRLERPYEYTPLFKLPWGLNEVKDDPRTHPSIYLALFFFIISSFFVILEFIMYPIYSMMHLLLFIILCMFSFILLLIYSPIHKIPIENNIQDRIEFTRTNQRKKDGLTLRILWKMTFSVMYSGMLILWIMSFLINRHILITMAPVILFTIILLSCVSFTIFLYFYKKFWLIFLRA